MEASICNLFGELIKTIFYKEYTLIPVEFTVPTIDYYRLSIIDYSLNLAIKFYRIKLRLHIFLKSI